MNISKLVHNRDTFTINGYIVLIWFLFHENIKYIVFYYKLELYWSTANHLDIGLISFAMLRRPNCIVSVF